MYEESDRLRMNDPTLPLLALCFNDGAFADAVDYDQLKRVSRDAIQAEGNKFPFRIRDEKLDRLVFRALRGNAGAWEVDDARGWGWNTADA